MPKQQQEINQTAEDVEAAGSTGDGVNYAARAQWLRAAVLGAIDGLVSVASIMIGVSAANSSKSAMLVAVGEFVSVYAQYDAEAAQIERARDDSGEKNLPSPTLAAGASALAFASGAALPLLTGGFVRTSLARTATTSVGLAGFGVASACLGGANMVGSGVRVLLGGWLATYGVLKLFGVHGV